MAANEEEETLTMEQTKFLQTFKALLIMMLRWKMKYVAQFLNQWDGNQSVR